jgi:hypothetical protein
LQKIFWCRERIPLSALAPARRAAPGTVGLGALRHGIIELAARHRLPAIYSDLVFATEGGLLAYGPDRVDQYRRAGDRFRAGRRTGRRRFRGNSPPAGR